MLGDEVEKVRARRVRERREFHVRRLGDSGALIGRSGAVCSMALKLRQ